MITSLVVAASRNDVIGQGLSLPWFLPEDLRHFKSLTIGHPVILGRLTHESILARLGHPLTGRTSIVISSQPRAQQEDGLLWVPSVRSAISRASEVGARTAAGEIFVIGGASVYRQALPFVDKIYLTRVHSDISGDASMPSGWLEGFRLVARDDRPSLNGSHSYSFLEYERS